MLRLLKEEQMQVTSEEDSEKQSKKEFQMGDRMHWRINIPEFCSVQRIPVSYGDMEVKN